MITLNQERKELERLMGQSAGVLKVAQVVEAARDPASPLHRHFEWDDTAAAAKYRDVQARSLIARCNITIDPREGTVVRAFVSLAADRAQPGGGYRLTAAAIANDDMRAQIKSEIDRWVALWRERAKLLDPEYIHWLLSAPGIAEQMAKPAMSTSKKPPRKAA